MADVNSPNYEIQIISDDTNNITVDNQPQGRTKLPQKYLRD